MYVVVDDNGEYGDEVADLAEAVDESMTAVVDEHWAPVRPLVLDAMERRERCWAAPDAAVLAPSSPRCRAGSQSAPSVSGDRAYRFRSGPVGYARTMTESEKGKSPAEKAKAAGDKLVEPLRPDEEEAPGTGGSGSGSSTPFSGGDRPDEQP